MVSFNTWFVCGVAGHFSCGRAYYPLHPSWSCATVLPVVPVRLYYLSNVNCAAQSAPCTVATWRCTTCVRFFDKRGAPFTVRMLLTWPRAACDRPTVVQRWKPRAQLSPGKASEHLPSLESTQSLRPSGVLDAPGSRACGRRPPCAGPAALSPFPCPLYGVHFDWPFIRGIGFRSSAISLKVFSISAAAAVPIFSVGASSLSLDLVVSLLLLCGLHPHGASARPERTLKIDDESIQKEAYVPIIEHGSLSSPPWRATST